MHKITTPSLILVSAAFLLVWILILAPSDPSDPESSENTVEAEPIPSAEKNHQEAALPEEPMTEETLYFSVNLEKIIPEKERTTKEKEQLQRAIKTIAANLPKGALLIDFSAPNSPPDFLSFAQIRDLTEEIGDEFASLVSKEK